MRSGTTTALFCIVTVWAAARPAPGIDVPTDVPTIGEALDLVPEGGLIRVAEGQYPGGFIVDKSVTIRGGYAPDFSGDPDPWAHPTWVVSDGTQASATCDLATGDAVTIENLIFSAGTQGLLVQMAGDASLALTNVTCRDNGRGLAVTAHDQSGLFATAFSSQDNATDGSGAGLDVTLDGDAVVVLSSSWITGNRAGAGGAGAEVLAAGNAAVSFIGTTLSNNGYPATTGSGAPGSLHYDIRDAAALFSNGSLVEGNRSATPGDAAVGGIQTVQSLVQIEETTFREGFDGVGGEAIDAAAGGIAAIRLVNNTFAGATALAGPIVRLTVGEQAVAFLLRNRLVSNTSTTHLLVTEQLGSSFVNVDGNVIRGNTTPQEAIFLHVSPLASGALMRAINNQVSANTALSGSGGGLFSVEGPNIAQIGHNTFYGNAAASGVAGIHLLASFFSPAEASNNVAVGNLAGGLPADLLVEGFLADDIGNFLSGDGDPGLRNPDSGNFRLRPDSVLVDAADPAGFTVDHDIEEDARPFGKASDIGSDELVLATARMPTTR